MDISTGSWFEYLREEVLTEGLRDIGLPERIVDFIENAMPQAPEKSKTYAGNQWKENKLNPGYVSRPQGFWVDWMRENFENEIMVKMAGDERAATGEIVARTITPYRVDRDVGPQQREQYDEETIEQNKKIAFVVQNVKAAMAKPNGTWRKSFMKALKSLSKSGVPSEKVEKVKEFLQNFMMSEFRRFWNRYDLLFSWLNAEPTNYEMIKGEDNIDTAHSTAEEDLQSREDPDNVIHKFDDGSYWYNLNTSNCSVEGERMGHCGSDSRGVLVSLRKRHQGRKASSSYITMTWEDEGYGGNYLYQIKGRSNDAPPHETWDHIDWFIKNTGITAVQESGEHSNDMDGFQEMNNYLQGQNPAVSFEGVIDEDAIQEAIDEVVNNYEGENSSISGEVYGPNDHGGDGGVYVYMNAYCSIQIELGWKGVEHRNNEYTPTLGPDDTTQDERFKTIPGNTWGGEAREFLSDTEVENVEWDLPGEGEIEWEVKMLEGVHPPGYEGDVYAPGPQTAVLEIQISMAEQEGVDDDDDATRNAQHFADAIMENFEDKYAEIHEHIRAKLAEDGYSAKTAFDREQQGMGEMELDYWKVYKDGPKLEFWFRRSKNDPGAVLNSGGEVGSIPPSVKMWGFDEGRDGHMDGLYSKMFGSRPTAGRMGRIENDDLSRNMARNLEKLYRAEEQPAAGQQQLALGDEYEAPPPSLVLAKDSRFIIMPETTRQPQQYPTMLLNWKYEIGVDAKSSPEEIETVKKIVKYFNEHPDMVEEAAAQTIRVPMESVKALADATKNDVMSGKWPQQAIQTIDSQYGAAAMSGSDEWAERKIMIAKWIKENFDQMDEVEKWVAWFKFLSPIKEGRFNIARHGEVEMDDNANLGRPRWWKEWVQDQMKKLGAWAGSVRDYGGVQVQEPVAGTLGEPQSVGESAEQQIDRIERLLQEKDPTYDLRLYSIKLDVSVQKDIGGEIQETQTEIRGIEGVTTVRTVGDTRNTLQALLATYEIKFELLGALSRVKYRDRILLPALRGVRGLRILTVSPIHRTNARGTIRTVRENKAVMKEYVGGSLGGLGGNLGAQRSRSTPPLPTPRDTLKGILDDWQQGGVMTYDIPMDTTNMAYHVMLPVEELLPLMGREFRAPMDGFEGMYQNFIKSGAEAPVYVAVGKNGRIKITGNEDLVWFAKKSGLEELPVFLSYQRQV
jgi:hypothetical protein